MESGDSFTSRALQPQMELEECSTSTSRHAKKKRGETFDVITAHSAYSSSSSTVVKKAAWDVFINHRGCDTKHTLASTIYHTLDLLGLRAFLDEEEIEKGDSIPQQIEEAMDTAGLHIAIFSNRYAESPWCLAELSFMLETGTPVLPIFYRVDPTDLRWVGKGKGCYAHAFSQHEEKGRYSSDQLKAWKTALQKVSYLSGHVLNNDKGDEGMLLKSIVNSVLRVMKKEPLEVAKHPVGMDEIVQDFERGGGKPVQSEENIEIVGIVGFGGSGKTTLATEIYNRRRPSFNSSSFLHDVRDAALKKDLHTKQKKLLEDLRIQTASFDNGREGKTVVADRLKSLRVLIVLDDVDHEDQLDALLPPKQNLGLGSIVVVTTREVDVLRKWGITSIYKMKPLQHLHAKQLFCWHAFLRPFPLQGFEDLVENYIDTCNGLPLSLKVIGGQLYGKLSIDYWVSQLDKIRRILPKEILVRLKVSYDALDEDEKEIFLDIACFFIGEKRSRAIAVWDGSGWSGLCSWERLLNKCLVEVFEVDGEEYIKMHDHLKDLGRQIAKTHSPSRSSCEKGTPFHGIIETGGHRVAFSPRDDGQYDFAEEYVELSRGLLWLRWVQFAHASIPSWLSLENIRVLEFIWPDCLETLWQDARPPLQLRELLIENAFRLQSLPKSIGRLKHLKILSLRHDCTVWTPSNLSSPSSLPEEICQLRSLEYLVLRGCSNLSSLPHCFGDLANLRHLDLSFCRRLKRLPQSFKLLVHLVFLDLDGCTSLESLENISNLKAVYFSEHGYITNNTSMGQLSLCFRNNCLCDLLPVVCQLSQLKELKIDCAEELIQFPTSLGNLSSLTTLTLINTHNWESLSVAKLLSLNILEVKDCYDLKKVEGLEHLTSLEKLVLWTHWVVPGIYNLGATEKMRALNLRADNISAFEPCIQSIQIEKWPWEITICGKLFPQFQSILDSFTFPGLDSNIICSMGFWSFTCREANLSHAAMVCFLVQCNSCCIDVISNGESTSVDVGLGEWIVISVFREVSRFVEEGGGRLHASIKILDRYGEHRVLGGRLMVGERGSVVEGFKKLFRTLCNTAPVSPSSRSLSTR